jgi:predicted ABC-type ATPase
MFTCVWEVPHVRVIQSLFSYQPTVDNCALQIILAIRAFLSYIFCMSHIYIIAGPNGAGKTTFVRQFIPATLNVTQFVNADLIAYGLSPFAPEREAVQAGKLMLRQIDKLVNLGESFCFETTLSGRSYARMIPAWQAKGFVVRLIFLSLENVELAIARVAERMAQGGHFIPEEVIRRRFTAGFANFHNLYKNLVDGWALYDNSGQSPILIDSGEK